MSDNEIEDGDILHSFYCNSKEPAYVAGTFTTPPWEKLPMHLADNNNLYSLQLPLLYDTHYHYKFCAQIDSFEHWFSNPQLPIDSTDPFSNHHLYICRPPDPSRLFNPQQVNFEPVIIQKAKGTSDTNAITTNDHEAESTTHDKSTIDDNEAEGTTQDNEAKGTIDDNEAEDTPDNESNGQDAKPVWAQDLIKVDPSEVVYERLYTPYAYVTFNDVSYGLPESFNLSFGDATMTPATRLVLDSRESCFKAELVLSGAIARNMSPIHNPQGYKTYMFEIAMSAGHIEDIDLQPPGTFTPPGALKDWDPKGKGYLTFSTTCIRLLNTTIPTLQDSAAEHRMRNFFSKLSAMVNAGERIQVNAVVAYMDFNQGKDTLLHHFVSRTTSSDDSRDNPAWVWSLNSPSKHQLLQGNLHPPATRPPLASKFLIRDLRRTYDTPFDMKVPAVYSIHDEHIIVKATEEIYCYNPPKVVFLPVPGSNLVANSFDNDLPKLYLASVRWDKQDMPRPRPGDRFIFRMPFEIPNVATPPEGSPLKGITPKPNPLMVQLQDYLEAGAEYTTHYIDFEAKWEHEEQMRLEYVESCRRRWYAEVIDSTGLNAPGDIMFKVFRPRDAGWTALIPGPHVGTIIPAAETQSDSQFHYQEYLDKYAQRYNIAVVPVSSDQTYKDTMRTLNQFFDEYDENQHQVLRHHLVSLMTTGCALHTEPQDFFAVCSNTKRFTIGFSPYQLERWKEMRYFSNGLKIIKGGPAAGKSAFLIAAALACATAGHQVAISSDTNDLANDLAQRLQMMVQETKTQNITIIRVLPNHVEDTLFTKAHIPFEDIPFFKECDVSAWLIQGLLLDQGKKATEARQYGDKRLRQNIKDISLHAAMTRELVKRPEEWANLTRLLSEAVANPYDKTTGDVWKKIKSELDSLRKYVLSQAHIVIATCDLFLRDAICKSLQPTLLLKDEDGASIRQKLMCLVTALPSLQFIALFGDTAQKGPFLLTAKENSPATFSKFPAYTQMAAFEDMGIVPVSLLEQHRMFNKKYVKWISDHYYNSALINGNARKAAPPQVKFCRTFIEKHIGISNNYAFVVLDGSMSYREDGTTSTVNPAMQQMFLSMLMDFKEALDTSDKDATGFDPATFQVGIVSSYLGVVNWFNAEIASKLDRRFTAQVIQTVQGSQKDFVIRINPGRKLSPFAGNIRDNLVADTRWRYGYIMAVTSSSLEPETYGKIPSSKFMFTSPVTKHVFSQYCFAKDIKSIGEITVPESYGKICRDCHQLGHESGYEDCAAIDKGPPCLNCGKYDHIFWRCPDPRIMPAPKSKRSCRRCQGPHHPSECDLPWCKQCQSTSHSGADCPNVICKRCGQTGHRAADCLTHADKKACSKCGSSDHSTKKCTVVINQQYAFARPEPLEHSADLLTLELRAHQVSFPEEYEDPADNQDQAPDQAGDDDGWYGTTDPAALSKKQDDEWGTTDQPGTEHDAEAQIHTDGNAQEPTEQDDGQAQVEQEDDQAQAQVEQEDDQAQAAQVEQEGSQEPAQNNKAQQEATTTDDFAWGSYIANIESKW